jgi:GNAT superfamily N-acetyltransferase
MIHPLVTRDPWLETFLKMACYKLKEEEPHNFNFEIIEEYPKKPFFLTCKIPLNISYQNVSDLSLLKEVNIQNSYFLQDNVCFPSPSEHYIVRKSDPGDYDAILGITSGSFFLSRFHTDIEIGYQLAESIKREWVISNLTSRENVENYVICDSSLTDYPLGFISCLITEHCLTIDLIAVDKNHRFRGLGRTLVEYAVQQGNLRKLKIQVGTQEANPVNSLYASIGFQIENRSRVLHYLHKGTI